jgi:epoxide hydrolase 4
VSSDTPAPWSHGFAELPTGVRLHYVHAGAPAAPLVLLLHGFPEFWYGWRHQIGPVAAAGFRVVAPDLRGYNLSSKPPRAGDYRVERLADDVLALARHLGYERVHLVGHDWGGVIAWWAAMRDEPRVERFVILNAPHPVAYLRELRRPRQLLRSWYVFAFQLPWLPEAVVRAMSFRALRRLFRREPARAGAFTEADIDRYVEAFSQPGALTAAINYYRAAARRTPKGMLRKARRIATPTLLIWGERDRYMVPEMAGASELWASDLRVERFPDATHWVQHDEPERVSARIIEFLAGHRAG